MRNVTSIASTESGFDPRDLRTALGQFASGVAVITTITPDGERVGVTANSFTSVSMDPPLVLWCPGKHLFSLPAFERATHFAINVLASDQHELSRKFSSPNSDKFEGVETVQGIANLPLLADAVATFECRTTDRHPAGDHIIYLGHVERYAYLQSDPLVFHGGRYHDIKQHRSEE
jgi:flavin reductase (DIM6/NTAB) family NADH-FMN oxidoreductase RutF